MTETVLAGGLLCDDRIWMEIGQQLDGNLSIVVFDHERSIMEMAQSILALPLSCFKLVGYSMGGMAALLAAALAPDRINSLLLIGTHAEPETEQRKANRARQIAVVERDGLDRFVSDELLPAYFGSEQARDLHAPLVASMARACGAARFRRHVQALSERPDPGEFLARLAMPVVVAAGSEDRVARPEWARTMATRLPAARFHELHGCGHMAPLECPAGLAGLVTGLE